MTTSGTRIVFAVIFLVGIVGAYFLGTMMQPSPPMGDAEIAYKLDRAAGIEIGRSKLLADELRLRSFDGGQCISHSALGNIMAWAERCVIADCTIDLGGKPFAGITLAPKAATTATAATTPAKTPTPATTKAPAAPAVPKAAPPSVPGKP